MNPFRNLDLYKGLILACLLLLPVAGWWIWSLQKHIEECQKAIVAATRTGGVLEEIGTLQKKMETVKGGRGGGGSQNAGAYFEGQILQSAQHGEIGSGDFTIPAPKEVTGTLNKQQKYVDEEYEVQFNRNADRSERTFRRDFLFAMLFNCESGAPAPSSVWKLRHVQLVNATDEKLLNTHKTPPPELEDRWLLKDLKFARRLPSTK